MPACKEKRFVVKTGRFSVFKFILVRITTERNALFVGCLNVDNSKSIVSLSMSSLLGVTHIPTSVIIAMRLIIDIKFYYAS
jgi:hypothetical protein